MVITAYKDRTFSFITKTPPVSFFLKKAAKLSKAANNPGKETVGKVTMSQIREIAEKKLPDLNTSNVDSAAQMVVGTARSMGLEVVEG